MNDNFISIKVDREERPDLDAIYMNAVQLITGQGGWPLTVFLTPAQVPFYGGTYFPPEDRHGMPGFARVLLSVARAYQDRKAEILRDTTAIIQELQKVNQPTPSEEELKTELLDNAAHNLMANYDSQNGGFGRAPKFPPSMSLTFLLRSYLRTEQRELIRQQVEYRRVGVAGLEQPRHGVAGAGGGVEPAPVVAQARVGSHGLRARHREEVAAALVQHEAQVEERLQAPTEAAGRSPHALRDRADAPPPGRV